MVILYLYNYVNWRIGAIFRRRFRGNDSRRPEEPAFGLRRFPSQGREMGKE